MVLMYHRVLDGTIYQKHANSQEMMRAHLTLIKERYRTVLPGDRLNLGKLSVCLTFDDASFDFYHRVFPLLKELGLKALLGVPARYIVERSTLNKQERLSIPYTLMMQDGIFDQKHPFCSWEEIEEMVLSGHVEIASHSYSHCNLTFDFVDLKREIALSKKILEERLSRPITSFIYPFGRSTPAVQKVVSEHYLYSFRIGSALNFGWGKGKRPLCRLPGDNLSSPQAPFNKFRLIAAVNRAVFM